MIEMGETVAAAWQLLQNTTAEESAPAGTNAGADTPAVPFEADRGSEAGTGGVAGATAETNTDTDADAGADADAVLAAEAAAAEARGETAEVLLEVAVACERMISYLHARQVRAMAGLSATVAHGSDPHGVDIDPSAPEVACALAWTPGAADARVQLALDLLDLPVVLQALQTARIDPDVAAARRKTAQKTRRVRLRPETEIGRAHV